MHKSALCIITTLLVAISCNKQVMEPQRMGSITLSVSSDTEVEVGTKADAVDCSGFLVDIYGKTFLGQDFATEQYTYCTMPQQVTIPYGYYNVSAQNCLATVAQTGFGCVHYWGESNQIDVLSKDTENVTVTCKMVNSKVTVIIDESFQEDFEDISIEYRSPRAVTLSTNDAVAPTDVYFNLTDAEDMLLYTVRAKVKSTGAAFEYSNDKNPVELHPAKWVQITISSNHNGLIGPDIDVDGEMGSDSFVEQIDPDSGSTTTDGTLTSPTIYIDTQIDDATVIDCIIGI